MVVYLDTSALVKLVVHEPESEALVTLLAGSASDPVSSDLARTELLRAVRRIAPDRMEQARAVLDSLVLVDITTAICEAAGRLDPEVLRSLDALHLASALDLGDDLDGMVTYDLVQAQVARALGIAVTTPT